MNVHSLLFRLGLLYFLFPSLSGFAQNNTATPGFMKDSIDSYIHTAMAAWKIPGVAVCVVKNGNVVLMKGYGVKTIGTEDKVDEHTLFMIGSNSKAFTATAIALLDAEKKISLDDLVTKWIPSFALKNKAAGEQTIVRDLLCHRLGFKTFQGDFTYWTSNLSRTEVIEKMSHINAPFPFRSKWGYTNAAFVVAGEIIPKATGLPWETFLTQKIFKPLGMNNTLALSADYANAPNKCTPHTIADGKLIAIPHCNIDNLAAAGSIGSSVHDMSKWVLMQLNNGKLNQQQIVPSSVIAQTRMPHSILGNGNYLYNKGHFNLYGLGWLLEEYSGRKIVSHTGGVNGFVTSVTLVPEENLGIIVLTNTDQNSFYEALKWEIMDAYIGNIYRNYSNTYLGFYRQDKTAEEKKEKLYADSVALHLASSLPLKNYTGDYYNEVYGNMKVVQEDNELKMKFAHHPNMYALLLPLGGNRFYGKFSDPIFSKAVMVFDTEPGKVKAVTVKVADFIEYDPYIFVKK